MKKEIKQINKIAEMARKHIKKSTVKKVKDPTVKYIRNTQALKLLKVKARFCKFINVFIGDNMTQTDKDIFFKGDSRHDFPTILLHYRSNPRWGQLLRDIGLAKSNSDARGAGWDKEIEYGFQDVFLDGLKNISNYDLANYHNPKGHHAHQITILKTINKK